MKTLEVVSARFPIGSRHRYTNPGKRGDGGEGVVTDYLCRHTTPDRVSHIELGFGTRRHVVTVNQLGKYYTPVP